MIARSVNAAADVIHRAQVNGAVTATGLAVALESAQMLVSPEMAHEAAGVEAARDALKARVDEVERAYTFDTAELKRRIAELLAERHTTNEALSDAAEQLRANRDRITELERRIAAEECRCPEPAPLCEGCRCKCHAGQATASADKLTALFAPTQALRVEASAPGACDACGDAPEQWCPDCAACKAGCHGGHVDNPCSHANAPWGGAR